jgi:hypothetical protein
MRKSTQYILVSNGCACNITSSLYAAPLLRRPAWGPRALAADSDIAGFGSSGPLGHEGESVGGPLVSGT